MQMGKHTLNIDDFQKDYANLCYESDAKYKKKTAQYWTLMQKDYRNQIAMILH